MYRRTFLLRSRLCGVVFEAIRHIIKLYHQRQHKKYTVQNQVEYNFDIKYKEGKLNSNADALSRIKGSCKLIDRHENIFENNNIIVLCIFEDKALSKGFAVQIDERFKSKSFLKNKVGNIIEQPISNNKILFHLVM